MAITPTSAHFSKEELAWLKAHPHIHFAPAPNYPPVEFFDKNNIYRGITADFIKYIDEKIGIHFEIIQLQNWAEVIAQAKLRKVDMWGAAAKTKAREQYMRFTKPYIHLPAVIIVRKEITDLLNMPDLKGKRVVVIQNYATQAYIQENYPFLKLIPVPDIETGLRMVSFGSADAIVVTNASAIYYIEKNGLTNLRVAGESGFEWQLRFAVRSDWPELAAILQKSLDAIPEHKKQEIFRRWISLKAPEWKLSKEQIIVLLLVLTTTLIIAILTWNLVLHRKIDTRTKQLHAAMKTQSLILQNAQIGIAHFVHRKVHWVNPMLAYQCGMPEATLLGKSTRIFFLNNEDYECVGEAYLTLLTKGERYETDILLRRGTNGSYWCRMIGQAIDPEHVHEGSIWIIQDISVQKKLEHSLTALATTDPLTGTYNRRHFSELAKHEIKRSARSNSIFSLLMLDIDHFKHLNDNYGHATGDEALKYFVKTVRSTLREPDILGRIGGEEFAVLLPDTASISAQHAAERIRQAVASSSFEANGEKIYFTVSIGLTQAKNNKAGLDALLERADKALYRAKRRGRNRVEMDVN
ncbi:diguanylate cyclase [Candidatus Venteria ishoeyi]|uniref:diguanylate cyclase n=1 Tax=Candidatus Venteria ishoeyi TaxID=1899563 RepID=A0A1H6FF38_9GAMM|nr:diguanylate cyclase [Candidatus Venteria ishoeyi]MDM8546884.1 diguanylate cyclase [Candidatus Venteria ishoeyi]SEH08698.1 putative diguanylate cyclase YdaM [Candidatus Venteria ishoeyi]